MNMVDIVWNDALEAAAFKLETLAGNEVYVKAWRAAAKHVRDMKKLTSNSKELTDNAEQISHSLPTPSR